MTDSKRWIHAGIGAGLVLLAAALRIYGIDWGLPDVYEEATPLRRAWGMWGWGPDNGFDPNPHFFNYPSLPIYVQFGGQIILLLLLKVLGAIDSVLDFRTLYLFRPTAFYVMGRSITALFGVGTVWLVYATGRRIGGGLVAIPAAVLMAVNTTHIMDSQVVSVDVPLAFFVTAFFWSALRLLESPSQKNYVITGVLLGLATSTKYTGALLIVSLLVAHLVASRRAEGARAEWTNLGAAVVVAVLAFYATSPFVLLDPETFRHDLSVERQHMRLGHFGLDGTPAWVYYARATTNRALGWPAALMASLGAVFAAAVRGRSWAIVMAVFVIAYGVSIGSWTMRAERYLMPVVPVLLLFAGAAVPVLLRARRMSRAVRAAAAAALTLIMAAPVVAGYPAVLARLKPDTRSAARMWIEANVPRGSLVVSEPYGPPLIGPLQLWSDASDISRHVVDNADVPLYAVQMVPMYQVEPRRSAVFYDINLYRQADVIVTSSAVRSRYEGDRRRFGRQAAFYDTLDANFEVMARFATTTGASPTIVVYGNPAHEEPFARRDSTGQPVALRPVQEGTYGGEEGFFYYNLGLNHLTFGDRNQAVACFDAALAYPFPSESRHVAVVERMVAALRDAGLENEAAGLITMAEARAPTTSLKQRLAGLRSKR